MAHSDSGIHTPDQYLRQTLEETQAIQRRFVEEHGPDLVRAAESLARCIQGGGKVLIFGNGGSAADAQHMAAEMVGRMLMERRALPAIALTTDSSNLTAIGNDYGYPYVFSRQIEGLAREGDVVVAISTSGNSPNVLEGIAAAKARGCVVIGLTGGTGGKLRTQCDIWLNASLGRNSSRVQESHIFAVHGMVDLMDRFFLAPDSGGTALA